MDGYALCVHIGKALLQVDEFGWQWPVRFRGSPKEEAWLGHAELGVEALTLRNEQIEVGLWVVTGVDVDRAYAAPLQRGGCVRFSVRPAHRAYRCCKSSSQHLSAR